MNKYLNGHFYIDQTLLFCHRSGALVIQDQVRDHDVATPALLCHKEPAPIIGPFRAWKPTIPLAMKNQRGAIKDPLGLCVPKARAGSLWHTKRAGVATP